MIQPIINLFTLANSGDYPGKHDVFYPFKNRFLRRWGKFDEYDRQVIIRECWSCDGKGWQEFSHSACSCEKCGGTGVWRTDVYWLERYRLGKEVFHIPVPAHKLPILIPDPVILHSGHIKHEPVDNVKARRACVALIILFDVGMAWKMFSLLAQRIWYRKLTYRLKQQWSRWRLRNQEMPF